MPGRKGKLIETAVVARKTIGQSNSQIAKDLDIARSTVVSIVAKSGFNQAVEFGQIRVHRIIPKTCDALERAIDKTNVPAILAVLNGTGVLKQQTDSSPVNVQVLVQVQGESAKIVKEIEAFQAVTDVTDETVDKQ